MRIACTILSILALAACGGEQPTTPTEAAGEIAAPADPVPTVATHGAPTQSTAVTCDSIAEQTAALGLDTDALTALTGLYAPADRPDSSRKWNIELACGGDALQAVPLWGDVAPPLMAPEGETRFRDSWSVAWHFELGENGTAASVLRIDDDEEASHVRLGPPRTFDQP